MMKLNGFVVIDQKQLPDGTYVILGARWDLNRGAYEYVTALMERLEDLGWIWGHYFTWLLNAVSDFHDRIGEPTIISVVQPLTRPNVNSTPAF